MKQNLSKILPLGRQVFCSPLAHSNSMAIAPTMNHQAVSHPLQLKIGTLEFGKT